MNARKKLNDKRIRRAARVTAKIVGTAERPRLVVNRSNRYIYAQLIDDAKSHTVASVTSRGAGGAAGKLPAKTAQAFAAGESLAQQAAAKGVTRAVFDRRSSKFHGRVKSFAEGMKKGGITI